MNAVGRSKVLANQIKGAVVYKSGAVLASFVSIPILLRYLGQERFGVWAVMLTMISWMSLFDFGIGNGLRNKIGELNARGELFEARSHISSAYTLVALTAFLFSLITVSSCFYMPWQSVFNTITIPKNELIITTAIFSLLICANFSLNLVGQIWHGLQNSSMAFLGQLLTNAFVLALLAVVYIWVKPSLSIIAIIYGGSLILSNLILSMVLYRRKPNLKPSLSQFSCQKGLPLINTGLRFFIVQLSFLVVFTSDRFIITLIFGPKEVASYEVANKLFSIFALFYNIILSPLWSSMTDAYHSGEFGWLKTQMTNQLKLLSLMIAGIVMMVLLGKPIIRFWVGFEVSVSQELILAFGIFSAVLLWNNLFSNFVNALGKLRISLVVNIVVIFINIPLSVILSKYVFFSPVGVVVGTTICLIPGFILGPLQAYYILSKKGNNIWHI